MTKRRPTRTGSRNAAQSTPKGALSSVRIIGGSHRSRKIHFQESQGLRPTPDRLRETLFNWLGPRLAASSVLDLCAGSGALGFESLSRGAHHCSFVEPHPASAKQIQSNADQLELHARALIHPCTAQQFIASSTACFDIAFVDPPYSLNLWAELLGALVNSSLIHSGSIVYVESDQPLNQVPPQLTLLRHKKVGSIDAGIYELN